MDRLDETDEQILAELAEHARATFAEIGQRVNLSAPAVKRRARMPHEHADLVGGEEGSVTRSRGSCFADCSVGYRSYEQPRGRGASS